MMGLAQLRQKLVTRLKDLEPGAARTFSIAASQGDTDATV